jgi:predicted kinase
MVILILMCGLPFSGKSTAARRIAVEIGAALVSLDALHLSRGLDPGRDIREETWAETGRCALTRADSLLAQGCSAVIDDTFSYRRDRDRFRHMAARRRIETLILFLDPPGPTLAARIEANSRRPTRAPVSPEVIEHIRREFERPGADEPVVRLTGPDEVETWLRTQGRELRGEA